MTDLLDLPEEPDVRLSVAATFGIASDLEVPAFSRRTEYVPDIDPTYQFDRDTTLAILAGLRPQPARPDPGLSRHRQVDPHRAGGGAAQLALHPDQPGQPHQPHRPDRQGRHRPQGRQADHRVPRGHPALVAAAAGGAGLRRVRRRPAGRDVRHPARAGGAGPHDPARPEQGDPPAQGVPPVRHRQHGGPGRHVGPLSRHAADQPGPDGPLEHRHPAELSGAWRRVQDRPRQVPELRHADGRKKVVEHGDAGRPHPQRLHGRRHLDRHVAAHGDHLGRECRDLRRSRLRVPGDLPQQVRRGRAATSWPSTTSAASGPSCPNPRPTSPTPEPSLDRRRQAESRRAAAGSGLHAAGGRGQRRRSRWRFAAASVARPPPRPTRGAGGAPGAAAARPDPARAGPGARRGRQGGLAHPPSRRRGCTAASRPPARWRACSTTGSRSCASRRWAARTWPGCKANLASAYRARQGQPQAGERGQDATMAEIVDLYARERLLGLRADPAAAQADGELGRVAGQRGWPRSCRPWPPRVADQEAFARQVRELLAHLGLSEQLDEPPDDSDREDQRRGQRAAAGRRRRGRARRRRGRGPAAERRPGRARQRRRGPVRGRGHCQRQLGAEREPDRR